MRMHLRFQNLHKGVVNCTKLLTEAPLLEGTAAEAYEHMQNWCDAVCQHYDLPAVRVEAANRGELADGGAYLPEHGLIVLTRPSLVWLFHQFRHHMQAHGKVNMERIHIELDAQGWAYSLLWTADPEALKHLVFQCSTPGLRPADLEQPTQPTWVPLPPEQQAIFDALAEEFIESLDDETAQLLEQFNTEEGT